MADIEGNDTAFFMHEEQLMSGLGGKTWMNSLFK